MRHRTLIAAVFIFVGLPGVSIRADVLFLSHGGRVEGNLLNPDESPRRSYLMTTAEGAKLSLTPAQVDRVVVATEAEKRYETFAAKLPDTAAAHWDAAERCAKASLADQRGFHLEQVVRLDPNHEKARHALGYSRIDGKWVRQAEAMEGKGYIRAGGAWRLPQELEIETATQEMEEREIKWRKDLKMWRDWIRLRARDPQKAANAEHSIMTIRDPSALPGLIDMLTREKEPALRMLLVDVIGHIGGPAALATLVRFSVEDRDPNLRDRCLDKLSKAQSKPAVRQFMKSLQNEENLIVQRAAIALERMNDPEATVALIDALITSHKFVEGSSAMSPTFSNDGGGGLSMGGGPKVVKKKLKNEAVLRTLTALNPGVNFGFDQLRWRAWYKEQFKPKSIVSLRRSE